jgi:hypothetical protein
MIPSRPYQQQKTPIVAQPKSYGHRPDIFTFEGSIAVLCSILILPRTLSTMIKYHNIVIKHTKHLVREISFQQVVEMIEGPQVDLLCFGI